MDNGRRRKRKTSRTKSRRHREKEICEKRGEISRKNKEEEAQKE
jgi:hypothetical protein